MFIFSMLKAIYKAYVKDNIPVNNLSQTGKLGRDNNNGVPINKMMSSAINLGIRNKLYFYKKQGNT